MDAEKREDSLRRSLAAFETERNSFKHETQLLGTELAGARKSLDSRANDLQAAQKALSETKQRAEELDGLLNCVQDQVCQTMRAKIRA